MNQEQYTNAMLKIAYHAGRAMAIEEIEKEGAEQVIKQQGQIRKPSVGLPATQAKPRGENQRSQSYLAANTQIKSKTPPRRGGNQIRMAGRPPTPGLKEIGARR